MRPGPAHPAPSRGNPWYTDGMDNQNLDKQAGALVFNDGEAPVHFQLGMSKEGVLFAPHDVLQRALYLQEVVLERPNGPALRVEVGPPGPSYEEAAFTVRGYAE